VAYAYSISTWATFKVFGLTGIMLVFMVAQGFYISRHLKDEDPPPPDKLPAPPASAGQEST
jgi:intracellular septation protein